MVRSVQEDCDVLRGRAGYVRANSKSNVGHFLPNAARGTKNPPNSAFDVGKNCQPIDPVQ